MADQNMGSYGNRNDAQQQTNLDDQAQSQGTNPANFANTNRQESSEAGNSNQNGPD